MRRALPVLIIVSGCSLLSDSAHGEVQVSLEARVAAESARVGAERGLAFAPPTVRAGSRKELGQWMADAMNQVSPEEWAQQQRFLRALGVLEEDEDWRALSTAVGETAINGYYDPERDSIHLVRPGDGEVDAVTLRHELVHALQDQHFGLDDMPELPNDVQVAMGLLAEGEATFTALAVELGASTVDWIDLRDVGLQVGVDQAGSPSNRMLRSFWHRYVRGAEAVQQLHRQGGWDAVDGAWRDPPLSSEALLSGRFDDLPRYAHLDVAPAAGLGWTAEPTWTMGAFELRDMLWAVAPQLDPDALADGWDGDRLQVLTHTDGRTAFVWRLAWDTPRAAERFAGFAKTWVPGDEPVEVEVRGDEVLLVSGLSSPAVRQQAWQSPFVEVSTLEMLQAFEHGPR